MRCVARQTADTAETQELIAGLNRLLRGGRLYKQPMSESSSRLDSWIKHRIRGVCTSTGAVLAEEVPEARYTAILGW